MYNVYLLVHEQFSTVFTYKAYKMLKFIYNCSLNMNIWHFKYVVFKVNITHVNYANQVSSRF